LLIVGELINTSRKAINEMVEKRDAESIKKIARAQAEAGADYLDVNCGTLASDEVAAMEWLVNTVQEAVDLPLCIDSLEPESLEMGLSLVKNGKPLINSTTGETETFKKVLPVVKKFKAKIIALCMNDEGIPKTAEERFGVAQKLIRDLTAEGVAEDDIYLDPLIQPISANDQAGIEVLKTLRMITDQYPKVHKICGLSNISFGSPNRKLLNRLFMVLTMGSGMDGYIMDPTDKAMMGYVHAGKALMGKDPMTMGYINAHRKGLYQV
jgi:5-methyltetrahydrofolate corrinoid/iron sulfur protein methyltransferase